MKCFIFFFLVFTVTRLCAQSTSNFGNQYSVIGAGKKISTPADYNLKANVKSVRETVQDKSHDNGSRNTITTYKFSDDGKLVLLAEGDSTIRPNRYQYTAYSYSNNHQLEKVTIAQKGYGLDGVTIRIYNADGYLTTEKFFSPEEKQVFNYTATYHYSVDYLSGGISFNYVTLSSSYERRANETFEFVKDRHGNLLSEIIKGDYGYTETYKYDSLLNKPVSYGYFAHCEGNSCLRLFAIYRYDEKGNVIEESLTDETIRNALWSYSYHFTTKYDARNNCIEKTKYHPADDTYLRLESLPDPNTGETENYSYIYDSHGNWIKKSTYIGKKLMSVTNREIEYY